MYIDLLEMQGSFAKHAWGWRQFKHYWRPEREMSRLVVKLFSFYEWHATIAKLWCIMRSLAKVLSKKIHVQHWCKINVFDVSDLSLSELTANSLFFVLSGYETVANALALTVLCLAEHPECQKKLTSEIRAGLETRNSTPQKDVSISADKRKWQR